MIKNKKNLFEVRFGDGLPTDWAFSLPIFDVLIHAIHAEDVATGQYCILVVLLAERAA
jgi:hypothetical protein